jgi:Papain-like cysteine protease AvrRpt2
MATESDYVLNPPKKVKQKSWATCWAAAFESILDATANSDKKTEQELVDKYANQVGGGIQPKVLGDIAKDFGFIFNIFLDSSETRVFSDSFIIERLKKGGALLAAPKVLNLAGGMPGYHAQVIYGVTYLSDSDKGTGNALINTMNPATGAYALYPLSYFTTNTPLFTCWKNA